MNSDVFPNVTPVKSEVTQNNVSRAAQTIRSLVTLSVTG